MFIAAPGFLQLGKRDLLSRCGAEASHGGGCSCCRVRALACWFSHCGAQAWLSCGMWSLPGAGINPMFPAWAGGFLTAGPPHMSKSIILRRKKIKWDYQGNQWQLIPYGMFSKLFDHLYFFSSVPWKYLPNLLFLWPMVPFSRKSFSRRSQGGPRCSLATWKQVFENMPSSGAKQTS